MDFRKMRKVFFGGSGFSAISSYLVYAAVLSAYICRALSGHLVTRVDRTITSHVRATIASVFNTFRLIYGRN